MSELPALFKDNALANSDLYKSLQDTNENLMGGSGNSIIRRRISLRGGRFREMTNGEQTDSSSETDINLVIVAAAPISRTYYAGAYDPQNPLPPTCWSSDTNAPAGDVPEDQKQSTRCMDCPQNVKGSGQGQSRACRFSQKLAVALEGKLDTVYQLQLPATSIFGAAENGKMPMQAYARFLTAHKAPAMAVVTNVRFDEDSNTPKLLFKPVRPLDESELAQVVELKDSPDTEIALAMSVAQTKALPKPEAKGSSSFGSKPEPAAPAEEPEEPKKVAKKAAPTPADDSALSEILDNWDD